MAAPGGGSQAAVVVAFLNRRRLEAPFPLARGGACIALTLPKFLLSGYLFIELHTYFGRVDTSYHIITKAQHTHLAFREKNQHFLSKGFRETYFRQRG